MDKSLFLKEYNKTVTGMVRLWKQITLDRDATKRKKIAVSAKLFNRISQTGF
jgi:hypothetical protein